MARETGRPRSKTRKSENGIITARPATRVSGGLQGLHALGLGAKGGRDGIVYVPDSYQATRPAPFILMLHGAGSNAHDAIQPFRRHADQRGLILVAPDARERGWDLLEGGFGVDVDFIDHALVKAFELFAIDSKLVAIEGFSDGASYALSLGLRNADLFTHVVAFSPGFMTIPQGTGKPKVFVSHGNQDPILPAVRCSHRIVSRLERDGYDVTFVEFAGGHSVPASISSEAVSWLLK